MERVAKEMGVESLKKSQISEVCKSIKDDVDEFMSAPLEGLGRTYIWTQHTLKSGNTSELCQKQPLLLLE